MSPDSLALFHPVILSGGNRMRPWPLSRVQQPKPPTAMAGIIRLGE